MTEQPVQATTPSPDFLAGMEAAARICEERAGQKYQNAEPGRLRDAQAVGDALAFQIRKAAKRMAREGA